MESTSFTRAAVTQLSFSLPPEPSRLLRARDRIRDFLQQHCADQSAIDDVVLCVEEACTNVIRHSGSREEMRIALRFAANDLVAEVTDHGKGFDTGAFDPDAVPDVGAPGGRGLFLMAHLMDEVALTRHDGLDVRMVKRSVARCPAAPVESGLGDLSPAARACTASPGCVPSSRRSTRPSSPSTGTTDTCTPTRGRSSSPASQRRSCSAAARGSSSPASRERARPCLP